MQNMILSFGVDIHTTEAKKLMAIVKRFCKAYDFKLIACDGPFAYMPDPNLAQLSIKLEIKDLGQFKKGFEGEYITGLLENCMYLQCNCMFECFKPILKII